MQSFDLLKKFTEQFVSLTEPEFDYLASLFEFRKFKRNQMLVREGEVDKYLNFIVSGLARLYFIRNKEEVVLQFSVEGEMICCYESFLTGKPSNFYSESIEPLELLSLSLENLDILFAFSPKIERLGRLYVTQEYLKKTNEEFSHERLDTQERFKNFFENHSDIVLRAPQKDIASYLGMKPETYSRLKHSTKGGNS